MPHLESSYGFKKLSYAFHLPLDLSPAMRLEVVAEAIFHVRIVASTSHHPRQNLSGLIMAESCVGAWTGSQCEAGARSSGPTSASSLACYQGKCASSVSTGQPT